MNQILVNIKKDIAIFKEIGMVSKNIAIVAALTILVIPLAYLVSFGILQLLLSIKI